MRSWLAPLLRLPIALLLAVGLLLQGMAPPPPPPSPASDPFWALGGICGPGHASGDPGTPLRDTRHDRCACCQIGPTPFLLPGMATAVPARLAATVPLVIEGQARYFERARPAYASRAPPAWG